MCYDDYDDHYCNEPNEDWVHIDDLPDLDAAKEHLKAVIHSLYATGSLDDLEDHLDELAHLLEVSMPSGKLKVVSHE